MVRFWQTVRWTRDDERGDMICDPRTVLIVAAEPVVRFGLAASISGRFTVTEAVGTLGEAARSMASQDPGFCLLLLDPPLPDSTVEETCELLISRHPTTNAVALFRQRDCPAIATVCQHGVRGLLDTTATPEELQHALEQIYVGDVAVHPSMLSHLVAARQWQSQNGHDQLTGSQLRVLRQLADGLSSKEIARGSGTTTAAVNHIVERACRRLGAAHRTHAIARAFRLGLLE